MVEKSERDILIENRIKELCDCEPNEFYYGMRSLILELNLNSMQYIDHPVLSKYLTKNSKALIKIIIEQ